MKMGEMVMFDGEVMVTQKTTFEVIHCTAGQPLAIAEFRHKEEAEAFAELLRERNKKPENDIKSEV